MKPEAALGRLINLREQLTDEDEVNLIWEGTGLRMSPEHYSHCIDDLDDIIRSIERSMKHSPCSLEEPCAECEEPDSEDMEPRLTRAAKRAKALGFDPDGNYDDLEDEEAR
ncbi:MAG: hypothetical protein ACXAEN_19505 [Candidatus Thorarchaeota archaeon]|jgi:hypothetical protein